MRTIKHLFVLLLLLFTSQAGNAQIYADKQNLCSSTAPIKFTTPAVSGATSYYWNFPAGWTGSSSTQVNYNYITPDGITGAAVSVQSFNGSAYGPLYSINMPLIGDDSRHNLIAMPNTQLMYVGTDQKLHHQRWDGSQWVYTAINPSGGWGAIRVAGWLASNDLGTIIYFKTTTNKLYRIVYVPTLNVWALQAVPTTVDAKNNITWRSDGLFYVGVDNNIYKVIQSSSGWSITPLNPNGWQSSLFSGTMVFEPNSGNNIYFKGTNNQLYVIHSVGTSPTVSAMGITSSNGELAFKDYSVYFKAPDNKIHYTFWNGSAWAEYIYGPNVSYSVNGFLTCDFDTDKIFYKGTDGKVYNVYPIGNGLYANSPLGGAINTYGDIIYMNNKVLYIAWNNTVKCYAWNGTIWQPSTLSPANAKDCSNQYTTFSARPGEEENDSHSGSDNQGLSITTDQQAANAVSLYPNPSKGFFTIEMPGIKTASIGIYDAQGRKAEPVIKMENDTRGTVDITRYTKGLYLVQIVTQTQRFSQKIMVQ